MNIYLDNCDDYFEAGFNVTPLVGKRPIWPNWNKSNLCDTRQREMENKNIGLICGKTSGVTVLDIDIKDEEKVREIQKLLPPLLCGKKSARGINYFFQYNGKESFKIGEIDILSDGRQTVLPPSIHPDTNKPYEWLGTCLLDLDVDDLPILTDEIIESLRKYVGVETKQDNTLTPSDGSRCKHGSHLKYSDMAFASFNEGNSPSEIVDVLLGYDSTHNKDVSYFACSTERWKTGDKEINAYEFVLKLFQNNAKKAPLPSRAKVTIGEVKTVEKKERRKFPKLEGIAQDMFEHVYNNSTKKRTRFSLASAISAMSICIGNKIRYDNIHPNLYTLIVADSGEGKDTPLKFPKQCLIQSDLKHLIGQSQPASDSGIIGPLINQPKRIDTIDEADILFSSINSKNNVSSSKMADVYAMLYTSCGTYFEGKITARSKFKKEGECENPYITMFCAMTPEAFRDSMTTKTINKGLGARFLYFVDEERKRNKLIDNYEEKIPQKILDFFKMWNDSDGINLSTHIRQIERSSKVSQQLKRVNEMYEEFKYSVPSSSKMRPIYNRAFETVVKLAIIHAASTNPLTTRLELTVKGIDWANEFMSVYFDNMKDFIEHNVSVNNTDRSNNMILDALNKKPEGLTKSEIYKSTRALTAQERGRV